jgi:Fibronectin type III domain
MTRIIISLLVCSAFLVASGRPAEARGIRTDTGPGNNWDQVTVTNLNPVSATNPNGVPSQLNLPAGLLINPLGTSPIQVGSLTPNLMIGSGWCLGTGPPSCGSSTGIAVPGVAAVNGDGIDAQAPPLVSPSYCGGSGYFYSCNLVLGLDMEWGPAPPNASVANVAVQVVFFNLTPSGLAIPSGVDIYDSSGNARGAPDGAWEIEFNCNTDLISGNGLCTAGASLAFGGMLYTATPSVLNGSDANFSSSLALNEFVFNNGMLYPPPGWVLTTIAAPGGLTAIPGNGNVALTWTATAGASSYTVSWGTNSGGENSTQTGIMGPTVTISGLTNGQVYFFKVAAVYNGVSSDASMERQATVLPSTPTGLAATAGNTAVTLSWMPVTGATSYNVYLGTSAGGEGGASVKSSNTPTAMISGLTNGQTYYFTVTAVDAGGASAKSSEVSATPSAPPAPSSSGGGAFGLIELLVGLALTFARSRSRLLGARCGSA